MHKLLEVALFGEVRNPEIKSEPKSGPKGVLKRIDKEETAEYRELARELGVFGVVNTVDKEVARADFSNWLSDHSLLQYDCEEVLAHLAKDCPSGKLVSLKALRDKDLYYAKTWAPTYHTRHGQFEGEVYTKPVPHAVLLLVKDILATFPSATFFVTDYAVFNPDPFLVVVVGGRQFFVEHWDEPTFGLKK